MIKHFFRKEFADRKIVFFIDNDAARIGLMQANSDSPTSQYLIEEYYSLEREFPSISWFARVASYSNIADEPSRTDDFKELAKLLGAKIIPSDHIESKAILEIILARRAPKRQRRDIE